MAVQQNQRQIYIKRNELNTVEFGYFEVIGIKKDFELTGYIDKRELKKCE